jgi:polysaccharide pyruvyl transferase WcaK-like protein
LFHDHFLPIRSWTVRSVPCKNALLSLGVRESNVHVGADWAWLYKPGPDRYHRYQWAHALWRNLGIDPQGPLIVVNVVNLQWRDRADRKRALASALDWASAQLGLQVAFFCNECRCGDVFDYAAALEVAAAMHNPASVVPNEYYSPDEAISLLSCATVALGERYHFLVESVVAGCVPVGALRGEKMRTLASDLAIPLAGTVEGLDKEGVTRGIQQALENRTEILCRLRNTRDQLARRAMNNLIFVRRLSPYADAGWQGE